MTLPLEYEVRDKCICGVSLAGAVECRRVVRDGVESRFVRCSECGSWCQSPQLPLSSLAILYDSDSYQGSASRSGGVYDDYEADEPLRLIEGRERFARDLAPLIEHPNSKVLEIGCASGSLLAAAREAGHEVTGVDLSPRFAEQAKRLNGIDVIVGSFLEVQLHEHSFDLIIFLGTFANLSNPYESMMRARRLLKTGGSIIANYPDCRSLPALLYGRNFWMFTPSAITFPSTRGFRRFANNCGFVLSQVRFDWQKPSTRKLLKHSGLGVILPKRFARLLARTSIPCRVPIPAVRFVCMKAAPLISTRNYNNFIFIVGCPRSGTYLISSILNQGDSITVPTESHFIPLFRRFLPLAGDLEKDANRRLLLSSIYSFLRIWYRRSERERDYDKVTKHSLLIIENESSERVAKVSSYPEIVHLMFEEFAKKKGGRRYGDKSAFFSHRSLEELSQSVAGNASFIHIVRDGRDVWLSWRKLAEGPASISEAAAAWRKHVLMKRRWGVQNPDRYIEVRYEDLLESPERELRRICDFLGLKYDDSMLLFYKEDFAAEISNSTTHKKISMPLDPSNKYKWRNEMGEKQLLLFEAIAGDALAEFGYELTCKPQTGLSRFTTAWTSSYQRISAVFTVRSFRIALKEVLPGVILLFSRFGVSVERICNSEGWLRIENWVSLRRPRK